MKKNKFLLGAFLSLMVIGTLLFRDELTYLIAALIATITIGVVLNAKTFVMALTRWSKANPRKAQIAITVMQLILILLGIQIGTNLRELEITISNGSAFVFSSILIAGFLMVPFRMRQNIIAIPKEIFRQRIGFMGIALSSFMLMIMMGNKIGDFFPGSPITLAVEKMDHLIHAKRLEAFIQQNTNQLGEFQQNETTLPVAELAIVPSKSLEKPGILNIPDVVDPNTALGAPVMSKKDLRAAKKQFMKEVRKAEVQGMCGLAIVLIILLMITACAGICLLIGGITGGSVLAAIIGPIVAAGSIWGIVELFKWCRPENRRQS